MTSVTTKVGRSGPAVRAVLAQFSPDECVVFEEQFRQALLGAEYRLDLRPAVADRWWGIPAIRANVLGPAERDLIARARGGGDTGWSDGRADGQARR